MMALQLSSTRYEFRNRKLTHTLLVLSQREEAPHSDVLAIYGIQEPQNPLAHGIAAFCLALRTNTSSRRHECAKGDNDRQLDD